MSLSRQDLVEALERTAQGDRLAFERVYAVTSSKLFGIVVRILGRRDLAEEVLQEVYIRVWQRAAEYNPSVGPPITWLVSIARNRALDEAKRKTMRSLDELPEVQQTSNEDDLLADYERKEERSRVQTCLDGLEAETSEIVRLVYHYGMTSEEIAGRVNRPVSTVKTWLRRSLAQLKNCLSQ
jgi:RNA polymerase sigma-70 factor (ECF subfamily)